MIDTSVKNIHRIVDVKVNLTFNQKQVLVCKVLKYLADLHLNFNKRRLELLDIRNDKPSSSNKTNHFLSDSINSSLNTLAGKIINQDVEFIPVTQTYLLTHSIISNSKLFVIDFSSAQHINWSELIEAHKNIKEAVSQNLCAVESDSEQNVDLMEKEISMVIYPRDLGLEENYIYIDKLPLSSSLFDIGVFLFHNAKQIVESGSSPYVLLNNVQNYYEAKYWSEIFSYSEEYLDLPAGSIKAFIKFDDMLPEFEKKHILSDLGDYLIAA